MLDVPGHLSRDVLYSKGPLSEVPRYTLYMCVNCGNDCDIHVQGFITGVGKGLLGTVAKPVAGLFDLASGTTAALRETTSRVSRFQPPPVRHRRCCIGSSGTLTCFSEVQAKGQEYLLRLNDGAQNEK